MEVWDPGPASTVSLILSQDDEHDDDGGDDDQDDVGDDDDSGQRWCTFSTEDYEVEDNSGGAATKTGLTQQKIYISSERKKHQFKSFGLTCT